MEEKPPLSGEKTEHTKLHGYKMYGHVIVELVPDERLYGTSELSETRKKEPDIYLVTGRAGYMRHDSAPLNSSFFPPLPTALAINQGQILVQGNNIGAQRMGWISS